LCRSVVICVVLLSFLLFYVLFVYVLYHCHRMLNQLQLTNISYVIPQKRSYTIFDLWNSVVSSVLENDILDIQTQTYYK